MEDVKLFTNAKGREKYENLADLYSIILATEHLERAYIRDGISAQEYTPMCLNLIAQFKTARHLAQESVPDIAQFMAEYGLSCPAAVKRLLEIGVPATVEHSVNHDAAKGQQTKYVAESVQVFITLMDALKLNMVAVDQIHPLLSDLIQSLNKVPLPASYEGKAKIKDWYF